MELFETTRKAEWVPLARRLAPKNIEEFAGQSHLLANQGPLRLALESKKPLSAIFFGPPGTGKTSLAGVLSRTCGMQYVELSCATVGIGEIRKAIAQAEAKLKMSGQSTLLVLDEIHHLNRTQQDILLPHMESGVIALIGVTTENPFFYIHKAILSRALVFEFKSLEDKDLAGILEQALAGLSCESKTLSLSGEARLFLIHFAAGDARRLLNALEFLLTVTFEKPASSLTPQELGKLLGKRQVIYDKKEDLHYDIASAFIKSMRGSDPDAAVYWLAKMLEGGEDPRFIARRIVIAASEDVGNADPLALVIAQSAFEAVEMLGLPEGAIPLAHAAIYVACAHKSNACYLALKAAQEEIGHGTPQEVPGHLKDAHLDGELGHGKNYLYAHDFPGHFVEQKYMEKFKQFYKPTDIGHEAKIQDWLSKLWKRNYKT